MFVPIDARTEFGLAVIKMDCADGTDTQNPIELTHRMSVVFHCTERVSGSKDMAGIETNGDSFRIADPVDYLGELLECAAEAGALASCRFEQALAIEGAGLAMDFIQGPANRLDTSRLRTRCIRTRVNDDIGNSKTVRTL